MYKKILVPMDLTHEERKDSMIGAAKMLADKGAKVIFATVIEDLPGFVASQIPEDVLEETRGAANSHMEAIARDSGLDAQAIIRRGHAANTILDIAEEEGVDCIVIGSHKPNWEDYLIGSTAARVVRHAKCSVHVLR